MPREAPASLLRRSTAAALSQTNDTSRVPTKFDLARAARSPEAREALVCAVLRGDCADQETDWIEWKGAVDVLEWGPLIAKHILGFANRDPGHR